MKHFRPLAVMLMSALLAAGTAAAADGKFGADRHAAMGLTCEACHAPTRPIPPRPTSRRARSATTRRTSLRRRRTSSRRIRTSPRIIRTSLTARTATTCTAKRRTSATSVISSASRCRKPRPVPSGSFRNIQPSESTDSGGFSVHACRSCSHDRHFFLKETDAGDS